MDKEEFLKQSFAFYKINLTQTQIDKFLSFYKFLIEENRKFNLTAITDFEEVVFKHFIDSCLPFQDFKQNSFVVDVGSGAGFPDLPLKILRDDLKIVMIDSLNKRVNFLNEAISLLSLKNISAVHIRAEEFAKQNFEKFDYALSRAVAQTPTLCEYLLPLVKIGGRAVMYKSQKLEEELSLSNKAISVLGGKIDKIQEFELKQYSSTRKILYLTKIKNTPKIYPRGKNLPKTKPIV